MAKLTKEHILQATAIAFAQLGGKNFSMRYLAKTLQTSPSSLYYYFESEEALLLEMFTYVCRQLGDRRAALPSCTTAHELLRQRIEFQIDHQQMIVAVLKCYLHLRAHFPKREDGFLPDKSALHMEEVLTFGKKTGEFSPVNIEDDAKVMTHAVNGFLLEYYPYLPSGEEKKKLVERIYSFFIRAL